MLVSLTGELDTQEKCFQSPGCPCQGIDESLYDLRLELNIEFETT